MAGTGTATFGCIVSGLATGTKNVQESVNLDAIVAKITDVNDANTSLLQTGDNTITVPAGATFAVIKIPTTPETVKWKGIGGDTGTQMLSNTDRDLFCVMLVSGLANFILNATNTIAGVEVNFI